MVTTGLTAGLSWVTALLPLIPACIILLRQSWRNPIAGCILFLSLLSLAQNLIINTQHLAKHDSALINGIFELGEWALLFYALRIESNVQWLKKATGFFLTSFSSIIITIYALEGAELYLFQIKLIEASVITALALYTLLQLVSDRDIVMFKTPPFWVAGSTLCFYGMWLFIEAIAGSGSQLPLTTQNDKLLLITAANVLRYILLSVGSTIM